MENSPSQARHPSQPCPFRENIPAYCTGTLDPLSREQLEKHAASCDLCQNLIADHQSVLNRLKDYQDQPTSEDLTRRIMDQIPNSAWDAIHAQKPLQWIPLIVKIAAVLAILLSLGAFLFFSLHQPAPLTTALSSVRGQRNPQGDSSHQEERQKALDWLSKMQEPDGSWATGNSGIPKPYSIGVTALATLALMDNNPNALESRYGLSIRKGINYLIYQQSPDGRFGPDFSGTPYNQGLGTLAMLNAGALVDQPGWNASASKALSYLTLLRQNSQQNPGRTGAEQSLASTIWPLIALLRADQLGQSNVRPTIDEDLNKLRKLLAESPETRQRAMETLIPAIALCFLMDSKSKNHPLVQTMLPTLHQMAERPSAPSDLYSLFFLSEALALAGDQSSFDQLMILKNRLASLQKTSGPGAGSWDAQDRWATIGGPVYATALATLSLGRQKSH